jgi:serine/threonine protein kinase
MLNRNSSILLADLGFAHALESTTITMAGAGTPAYMAPEHIRRKQPLPQTDIYALGIILIEMLSGRE